VLRIVSGERGFKGGSLFARLVCVSRACAFLPCFSRSFHDSFSSFCAYMGPLARRAISVHLVCNHTVDINICVHASLAHNYPPENTFLLFSLVCTPIYTSGVHVHISAMTRRGLASHTYFVDARVLCVVVHYRGMRIKIKN
jgi:hypothetical protein